MATEHTPSVLPMKPKTIGEWEADIAAIRAEGAQIGADLDAIMAERSGLALAATSGRDGAAMAQVAVLNQRQITLSMRQDLLTVAALAAEDRLAQARQAELDALTAAQRARLVEGAERTAVMAGRLDAKARDLGRALAEFSVEVEALRRDGLDSTYHGKLRNRTMMAGAMYTAGLAGHVPLQAVSPHHRTTMEAWTRRMLGYLLTPTPAQAEAAEAA